MQLIKIGMRGMQHIPLLEIPQPYLYTPKCYELKIDVISHLKIYIIITERELIYF